MTAATRNARQGRLHHSIGAVWAMSAVVVASGCSVLFDEATPAGSTSTPDVQPLDTDSRADVAPSDGDDARPEDAGDDVADVHPDVVDDDSPEVSCERACAEVDGCGLDPCGNPCPGRCPGEAQACLPDGRCAPAEPMTFAWVPAGTFLMGSPQSESGRQPDEQQHRVTLAHDFLMLSTEVDRVMFKELMAYDPSRFSAPDFEELVGAPVENVTWHEAARFCNVLSGAENLPPCYRCVGEGDALDCRLEDGLASIYACRGYRLPTEAEWEYAARGGTPTATYAGEGSACADFEGVDGIGWWQGNQPTATAQAQPVGLKRPNAYGLYDMLGNVFEYTNDLYGPYPSDAVTDPDGPEEGTVHVARGGWGGSGRCRLRAAIRIVPGENEFRNGFLGFRVVRTMDR